MQQVVKGIDKDGSLSKFDVNDHSGGLVGIGEDHFDIQNYNRNKVKKDLEWFKQNLDNEEEFLQFLYDPQNNLED